MRTLGPITDRTFTKPLTYNAFQRFWLKLIADERDLPFVNLTLKLSLIVVPIAAILFFPIHGWAWWAIWAVYLGLINFYFLGPYMLMLHCISHRRFFNKEYEGLNYYCTWFLGLFFGQTPDTYYVHHLGMHHVENNLEDDISSTMQYQRDSLKDFMRYFLKFIIRDFILLAMYLRDRKRYPMLVKLVRGEIAFYILCILLSFVSLKATLMVFVLQYFVTRLVLMMGNWTQHAFVDAQDPGNCYKNSITCINSYYNRTCWNDGYHINHHLRPSLHWSAYPEDFLKKVNQFAANKALVFEDIDYFILWFLLMGKNYQKISSHLVNINNMFASDEEAISLIKARLRRQPKLGLSAKEYRMGKNLETALSA